MFIIDENTIIYNDNSKNLQFDPVNDVSKSLFDDINKMEYRIINNKGEPEFKIFENGMLIYFNTNKEYNKSKFETKTIMLYQAFYNKKLYRTEELYFDNYKIGLNYKNLKVRIITYIKLDNTKQWKPLLNFEDDYIISDYGDIYSMIKKDFKKIKTTDKNYGNITLINNYSSSIYRLVYLTYNGPIIDGNFIVHIDGNNKNNYKDNLKQITRKEYNIYKKEILNKNNETNTDEKYKKIELLKDKELLKKDKIKIILKKTKEPIIDNYYDDKLEMKYKICKFNNNLKIYENGIIYDNTGTIINLFNFDI